MPDHGGDSREPGCSLGDYDSGTGRTFEMGYMLSLATVPEPSTYAAVGGLVMLGAALLRRRLTSR